MIRWLLTNYVEVLGAISGLVYLYFSIRQKIWLWPVGIITSFLYIFIFFGAKFYADMSLQFYYLVISIYGWYHWRKGTESTPSLPIIRAGLKEWIIFIAVTLIMTVVAGYFLANFTDSPLPYWDAFTTSGSIVATWMLARKYLEQWLFWIVVDFVSLCTYIYKELYPTVILFGIYTIMSVIGYVKWKKDLKTEA